MAALRFSVKQALVALTVATERTVLQIVAPAQQAVRLCEFSFSFDGANPSAVPGRCQVLRQTSAGTMSAATPLKLDAGRGETIQSTAQHSSTGTIPTAGDILIDENVHPQTGYTWVMSALREIIIAGGTRLGFNCTFAAGVNATVRVICEE